jgi:CheY-like chemotaxis protein
VTAAGAQCGVIVADNDAIMRGILRSVLAHAGQRVFLAADGLEALTLARQFVARLVLLDIDMPRLGGLLACETIHALPGYGDVPIVIVTGYKDDRLRMAAHQLGAMDFITKPFQPNVLLARLAGYLDISARSLPIEATTDDVGTLDGRATVWRRREEPRATGGARDHLREGHEILSIVRDIKHDS